MEFFDKVRFGKESGLKFPGERIGKLQNYEKWTQSDIASQSFGWVFQQICYNLQAVILFFPRVVN